MTGVELFGPPAGDRPGFAVVAGAPTGLARLLLAVGRLPAGDHGPEHLHEGEEILHVLSGRLRVRIDGESVDAGPGTVVAVPAGALHGFDAAEETLLEVVAEQRIGTLYRVRDDDGGVRTVEVHRADMPWGRPPPEGHSWTSDAELRHILAHVDPADPSPPAGASAPRRSTLEGC